MNWGRKEQKERALLAERRHELRCSNPGDGQWRTDAQEGATRIEKSEGLREILGS